MCTMCASVALGQRMMESIMLLQPYILENPHLENFLYPDHHHGDDKINPELSVF